MTETLGQLPAAPLVYVLAEVRCSPTLDVAKRAAAIQEAIRDEFPFLEPVTELRLPAGTAQSAMTSTMYAFMDRDRRRGVIVTSSSLCYHVTKYETAREFFDELSEVLARVESVYSKDAVTRLGLRYVDAIVPGKDETVLDYIAPELGGICLDNQASKKIQCVVEQSDTHGGIAVRLLALGIPLYLSPDLPAIGLHRPAWVDRALERQLPAAILDTDSWVADERLFNANEILTAFKSLKHGITSAFSKATTEHAFKVWNLPRVNER